MTGIPTMSGEETETQTGDGHVTTETDCSEAATSQDGWRPPEARSKAQSRGPFRAPRKQPALLTPSFWTHGPQTKQSLFLLF